MKINHSVKSKKKKKNTVGCWIHKSVFWKAQFYWLSETENLSSKTEESESGKQNVNLWVIFIVFNNIRGVTIIQLYCIVKLNVDNNDFYKFVTDEQILSSSDIDSIEWYEWVHGTDNLQLVCSKAK